MVQESIWTPAAVNAYHCTNGSPCCCHIVLGRVPIFQTSLICSRFQSSPNFVFLTFDITRRQHTIIQSRIQTYSHEWVQTEQVLQSLTPEELYTAAALAEEHKPIENSRVKTLLRAVSRIASRDRTPNDFICSRN